MLVSPCGSSFRTGGAQLLRAHSCPGALALARDLQPRKRLLAWWTSPGRHARPAAVVGTCLACAGHGAAVGGQSRAGPWLDLELWAQGARGGLQHRTLCLPAACFACADRWSPYTCPHPRAYRCIGAGTTLCSVQSCWSASSAAALLPAGAHAVHVLVSARIRVGRSWLWRCPRSWLHVSFGAVLVRELPGLVLRAH